ncbi:MAG: hypothetical protein EOO75_13530, partial [Myxococcales bacterium]
MGLSHRGAGLVPLTLVAWLGGSLVACTGSIHNDAPGAGGAGGAGGAVVAGAAGAGVSGSSGQSGASPGGAAG